MSLRFLSGIVFWGIFVVSQSLLAQDEQQKMIPFNDAWKTPTNLVLYLAQLPESPIYRSNRLINVVYEVDLKDPNLTKLVGQQAASLLRLHIEKDQSYATTEDLERDFADLVEAGFVDEVASLSSSIVDPDQRDGRLITVCWKLVERERIDDALKLSKLIEQPGGRLTVKCDVAIQLAKEGSLEPIKEVIDSVNNEPNLVYGSEKFYKNGRFAEALAYAGDFQGASEIIQSIEAEFQKVSWARYRVSHRLAETGKIDQALEMCSLIGVRLKTRAHLAIASCAREQGDRKRCLQILADTYKMILDSSDSRFRKESFLTRVAIEYVKTGDLEGCLAIVEKHQEKDLILDWIIEAIAESGFLDVALNMSKTTSLTKKEVLSAVANGLSNSRKYEEAIEILVSIKDQDEDDLWQLLMIAQDAGNEALASRSLREYFNVITSEGYEYDSILIIGAYEQALLLGDIELAFSFSSAIKESLEKSFALNKIAIELATDRLVPIHPERSVPYQARRIKKAFNPTEIELAKKIVKQSQAK